MKGFLRYSKNRFLYNALRVILLALIAFFFSRFDVKAMPSGEAYSEFATNKVEFAKIYTNAGSLPLYANGGTSRTCGTYSDPNPSAYLNCWANGTLSLLTYSTNVSGNHTSIGFDISKIGTNVVNLEPDTTYLVSINYVLSSSSYSDMKNYWKVSYSKYEVHSFNSACSGVNCNIKFVFTSKENSNTLWLNKNTSLSGYTFQDLNKRIAYLFMPTISVTTISPGADNSVIEGNQTIIIDQNQTIINQNKETNDKLGDINNSLSDDTPPNSDISSLGNVQGLLPPGPVDSLLNIPFEFLSVINSSFGGVCVPISGKFVFDSTLTLPCFSEQFYNEVPEYLMNFLSLIPAAFILIGYFKHLYKKVDRAISMESNSDDEWGVL